MALPVRWDLLVYNAEYTALQSSIPNHLSHSSTILYLSRPESLCLVRGACPMNGPLPQEHTADLSVLHRIDVLCDQFEDAWQKGKKPRIEDYLTQVPEAERSTLLRHLMKVELELRHIEGGTI